MHLGPRADAASVAESLDDVATNCSPHRDLAVNPAKMLAIAMADTNPLVWGRSVLAARAARRLAEMLRRTGGRSAIAGDAERLQRSSRRPRQHDVFADPFADESADLRPLLLILDDRSDDPVVREQAGMLRAAATRHGVRVETLGARGRRRGGALCLAVADRHLCRGVPPHPAGRGLSHRWSRRSRSDRHET